MRTVRWVLAWLPFVAALSATVYLLVVPIWSGTGVTATTDASGHAVTTTWTTPPQRVVEVGGAATLAYLLALPAIAAMCSWGAMRSSRWQVLGAALLLVLGVFLGVWSIGPYYLPAAGLALVDALLPWPRSAPLLRITR